MTRPQHYERLIEAVRLLAADYETQIRALPDFVHVPDEIALIFDDCLLVFSQSELNQFFSQEQVAKIRQIDHALENMSNEKENWNHDALRNRPAWREVRLAARELLDLLGEQKDYPDIDWIDYVRGDTSA